MIALVAPVVLCVPAGSCFCYLLEDEIFLHMRIRTGTPVKSLSWDQRKQQEEEVDGWHRRFRRWETDVRGEIHPFTDVGCWWWKVGTWWNVYRCADTKERRPHLITAGLESEEKRNKKAIHAALLLKVTSPAAHLCLLTWLQVGLCLIPMNTGIPTKAAFSMRAACHPSTVFVYSSQIFWRSSRAQIFKNRVVSGWLRYKYLVMMNTNSTVGVLTAP